MTFATSDDDLQFIYTAFEGSSTRGDLCAVVQSHFS